jgi:hypothetical protein
MEWNKINTFYETEEKAKRAAGIISITESRLASQHRGAQYEVETKIEQVEEKWQIFWRKKFIGQKSGCGGSCNSCNDKTPIKSKSKIIPFPKLSE